MITRKNLERLAKNTDYDPEEIGIAILRTLGYKVEKYRLSGAVAVYKNGKLVFWYRGVDID
jgi:hypothetical protein